MAARKLRTRARLFASFPETRYVSILQVSDPFAWLTPSCTYSCNFLMNKFVESKFISSQGLP
jgi:hypothetical protein